MTTIDESTTFAQQLGHDILRKIFGEEAQTFDMQEGTVLSNTDNRVIYLSSDVIHAIYDVLTYEAGEAWSLILKHCGVIWGTRVSGLLEKELQGAELSKKLGTLSVESYLALLETYFVNHGWGKMRFHLENAENHGIIRASLNHSLFAHTLKEVDGPVDYMIAGMLESIFSEISGQTLGCTQISYNYSGANTSEFLISGSARIANLEQVDIHNMNPNDALDVLRIA